MTQSVESESLFVPQGSIVAHATNYSFNSIACFDGWTFTAAGEKDVEFDLKPTQIVFQSVELFVCCRLCMQLRHDSPLSIAGAECVSYRYPRFRYRQFPSKINCGIDFI